VIGDAGKDIGQLGLWIDIVELGGDDEAIRLLIQIVALQQLAFVVHKRRRQGRDG